MREKFVAFVLEVEKQSKWEEWKMVQAVENQVYAFPNTDGAKVNYKERYENYIGGQWTPPVNGEYFDNPTPVTGQVIY